MDIEKHKKTMKSKYPRIDWKRLTSALGWCIVVGVFILGFYF